MMFMMTMSMTLLQYNFINMNMIYIAEADQTNYTDHKEQNDDKARNENGEPEGNQTLYPDLSRDKLTNRHSVSPEDANTMSNVLEKSTVHMERQIGLLGGISLIVGTMIGVLTS